MSLEFIKYLDFFSIQFSFYTNRQPKAQNVFGGIMSLIYALACAGIFILFSYEDLGRLNPITSISDIPDSKAKKVNMTKEKIWIPFRIVTNEKKFIDHRGILNIIPYYVEGNNKEKLGMKLKSHLLDYKLCNETSMINSTDIFKIEVPLNELFCIDKDDIYFGGSWNDDFINYLEINLYLCKDDIYYNSSEPKCTTTLSELLKNMNIPLSFDFYYPVIQFQPTNFKIPLSIIYKNYIYQLSTYSYKIEKLYIQEHILSDDKNMIYSNNNNISCWGTSSLYGDDYYISYNDDPLWNNNINKIYTMEIFMDTGYVYYTRTYKKILTIISNIFPMLKFVLYFFKLITKHIKMSETKRKLAGFIFENIDKTDKKPKKILEKKFKESDKNSKKQSNILIMELNKQLKNSIEDVKGKKIDTKHKNSESKDNDNNKSDVFLNNDNVIKNLNKNDISLIKKKEESNEVVNIKTKALPKKKIQLKRKETQYIFPFYYFLLDFFFDKLIFPKKFFCVSRTYFTVYNFMGQMYDISSYIILFKQFNLLNKITMERMHEEDGVCPTKPYNKINIGNMKVVEKLDKDLGNKRSILFSNNLLL
jgi:hypothetical protein